MEVKLTGQTDLAGFRSEARLLLAHQVPPDDVEWTLDLQQAGDYAELQAAQASRPRNVARAVTAIVPASFTRLCEFVVLHRDPERFSLLYRLLWRFVHEPGLRNDPLDAELLQAQHMAHAVRRDIHKMKSNVKLHPVRHPDGQEGQVGWYEPTHHVVETVAAWFCKRLPASRWALFTPERSVRCEENQLLFGPGLPAAAMPGLVASDEAWLAVYHRVFDGHDRTVDA